MTTRAIVIAIQPVGANKDIIQFTAQGIKQWKSKKRQYKNSTVKLIVLKKWEKNQGPKSCFAGYLQNTA